MSLTACHQPLLWALPVFLRARPPPCALPSRFVLVRVLRVPVTNPLTWQLSLVDWELDEVLRCADASRFKMARPAPAPASRPAKPLAPGEVPRRPLDPDEPCPICYEDMSDLGESAELLLVHCKFGCGRNVHGRCMRVWQDHQASSGWGARAPACSAERVRTKPLYHPLQLSSERELTCPLCRAGWGPFTWTQPRMLPERRRAPLPPLRDELAHPGTTCGACKKQPIVGRRYRCLICQSYDLCEACFDSGSHPAHPFYVQHTPDSEPVEAERSLPPEKKAAAPSSSSSSAAAPGTGEGSRQGRRPAADAAKARKPLSKTVSRVEQEAAAREVSLGALLGISAVGPPQGGPEVSAGPSKKPLQSTLSQRLHRTGSARSSQGQAPQPPLSVTGIGASADGPGLVPPAAGPANGRPRPNPVPRASDSQHEFWSSRRPLGTVAEAGSSAVYAPLVLLSPQTRSVSQSAYDGLLVGMPAAGGSPGPSPRRGIEPVLSSQTSASSPRRLNFAAAGVVAAPAPDAHQDADELLEVAGSRVAGEGLTDAQLLASSSRSAPRRVQGGSSLRTRALPTAREVAADRGMAQVSGGGLALSGLGLRTGEGGAPPAHHTASVPDPHALTLLANELLGGRSGPLVPGDSLPGRSSGIDGLARQTSRHTGLVIGQVSRRQPPLAPPRDHGPAADATSLELSGLRLDPAHEH